MCSIRILHSIQTAEGNQNVRIFFLLILADFEQLIEDRRRTLGSRDTEVQSSSIDKILMKALQAVKVAYGEGHVAMGDIMLCITSSKVRTKQFAEALDWGGQALLSRISTFGYVHSRTADAHFNMGLLYRLNFNLKESLKELKLCRSIRMTIESDQSLAVAEADYSIALTQKLLGDHSDSCFSFYQCLRVRCKLLGSDHIDSIRAFDALVKQRDTMDRNAATLGAELKDRLRTLREIGSAPGIKRII